LCKELALVLNPLKDKVAILYNPFAFSALRRQFLESNEPQCEIAGGNGRNQIVLRAPADARSIEIFI